jgi:hypothetical protein
MLTLQLLQQITNLRSELENTKYKNIKISRATNVIKLLYKDNNKTHIICFIDINSGNVIYKNIIYGHINNYQQFINNL